MTSAVYEKTTVTSCRTKTNSAAVQYQQQGCRWLQHHWDKCLSKCPANVGRLVEKNEWKLLNAGFKWRYWLRCCWPWLQGHRQEEKMQSDPIKTSSKCVLLVLLRKSWSHLNGINGEWFYWLALNKSALRDCWIWTKAVLVFSVISLNCDATQRAQHPC